MTAWHDEDLHPWLHQQVRIDEMIYEGRTAFQTVRIFHNEFFGRVLTLDGIVQTTEADEFAYHEMIAHVPMIGHGAVKHVLIVGGGDGGCLEEVLKHPVDSATMVDIDGDLVALCREHMPTLSNGAFDDPRTDLIIGDGLKLVEETDRRFDVIIVDSTDPIGPGKVLFEEPFYRNCRRCLTPTGVLVTQNGCPAYQLDELRDSLTLFRSLYRHGGAYLAPVPTYVGGDMAYGWASEGTDLTATALTDIEARTRAADLSTRYYNAEVHKAAFALPNFIRAL